VYFGYGTNKDGMVQIVDREKLVNGPAEPTSANLRYPEVGRLVMPPTVGAHTAFPLIGMEVAEFAKDKAGSKRNFVAIVDESLVNECSEARQMLWIADITSETRPMGVASWTVPEQSGNFCERGGLWKSAESAAQVSVGAPPVKDQWLPQVPSSKPPFWSMSGRSSWPKA
jgi:hypothetical protein